MNKQKPDSKLQKKNSKVLSLTGFAFSLLIGLVLASVVWWARNKDGVSITVTLSNFFITPGIMNLVFATFWLMSRYGYGNNLKFYLYKRRMQKMRKYNALDPELKIIRSPIEYEKFHQKELNESLIGLWLTFGVGGILFLVGLILAFV